MIENQNNFKLIAKTLYGLENELYKNNIKYSKHHLS